MHAIPSGLGSGHALCYIWLLPPFGMAACKHNMFYFKIFSTSVALEYKNALNYKVDI